MSHHMYVHRLCVECWVAAVGERDWATAARVMHKMERHFFMSFSMQVVRGAINLSMCYGLLNG
jgi:hypothetical protein